MTSMLLPAQAWAADYSQYSTEELVRMRTQARDMSTTEREQFQQELHKRTRNLNQEERQRLGLGQNAAEAREQKRERDRTGENNDRGGGELTRERERAETRSPSSEPSNYGRGYENRQSGDRAGREMPAARGAGGGRGR